MESVPAKRFREEFEHTKEFIDRFFCVSALDSMYCGDDYTMLDYSTILAIYVPIDVNRVKWRIKGRYKTHSWYLDVNYCPEPSLKDALRESKRLPSMALRGVDTKQREYTKNIPATLLIKGSMYKRVLPMQPYIPPNCERFVKFDRNTKIYKMIARTNNPTYPVRQVFTSQTENGETLTIVKYRQGPTAEHLEVYKQQAF